MEVTRRKFSKTVASVGLFWLGGLTRVAKALSPRRFLRALKSRSFPGHIRPWNSDEVAKPGKWRG